MRQIALDWKLGLSVTDGLSISIELEKEREWRSEWEREGTWIRPWDALPSSLLGPVVMFSSFDTSLSKVYFDRSNTREVARSSLSESSLGVIPPPFVPTLGCIFELTEVPNLLSCFLATAIEPWTDKQSTTILQFVPSLNKTNDKQ